MEETKYTVIKVKSLRELLHALRHAPREFHSPRIVYVEKREVDAGDEIRIEYVALIEYKWKVVTHD